MKMNLSEKRKLHRRAYKLQQENHREVCGLIFLNKDFLELWYCKNISEQSYSFQISCTEIDDKITTAKSQKKKFIGVFHSHPISEAIPSKSDIEKALPNKLMMIYDVCGREAKIWKVKNGKPTLLQTINTGFYS